MELQARPYRDSTDMAAMREMLMIGPQANTSASYMHPGCLDWATQYPPDEAANRRNLYVWEGAEAREPGLKAWAIFQHHEGSFDLFVHPGVHGTGLHERVMDEYVAWAEARAREAGLTALWPWWAMTYDTVLTHLMEARGFVITQADPAPPLFERTLDDLPVLRLPEGYTVQDVQTADDVRLRARVTQGAFQPDADWEAYAARYEQFVGSAVYAGERDLLVRAPDGRGAAACTIWFDPVNKVGLFEPVGTHPEFQGKGLGKAVMTEGMRRMRAAGMTRAQVGFDPNNAPARALYTSLGFGPSSYFTVARKEL